MFRLFFLFFFKSFNTPYESLNESSLSKFINNENLRTNILSKKKFFHLWRKRLNSKIINEHHTIKKIKLIKKHKELVLCVQTLHSFTLNNSNNKRTSSEVLNYIFVITKFKITNMACLEHEPDKYKKLLYTGSNFHTNSKQSVLWSEHLDNFDSIFNSYLNYFNNLSPTNKYRTNKLYKKENAVLYARKYAINYNPYYIDFNNSGGDCTNFISQCLYAGDIHKSNIWKPYTPPWIRVNELHSYLTRNNLAFEVFSLKNLDVGDLIQFFSNSKGFFAHSGIISDILPTGEILYCCHTYDKLDFPLSEIYPDFYTKLRLLKITY